MCGRGPSIKETKIKVGIYTEGVDAIEPNN